MDRRTITFLAAGLLVALLFAVVVSQFASDDPDGLEYVAEQQGFGDTASDHALGEAPLADYGGNLGDNSVVNTAIAGVVGVLATLVLGTGLFWLARRRSVDDAESPR